MACEMSTSTTPAVVFGLFYQFCRYWVHLDIACGSQEVPFIHWKRSKSFLPKMASPFFPKVNVSSIAAMRFPDGSGQASLRLWNRNQVNMIRHQAPCPDTYQVFFAPVCHELNIDKIVIVAEKCLLPAIASLDDEVRIPRGYDTCDSGHGHTASESSSISKINILSPEPLEKLNIKDKYTVPRTPDPRNPRTPGTPGTPEPPNPRPPNPRNPRNLRTPEPAKPARSLDQAGGVPLSISPAELSRIFVDFSGPNISEIFNKSFFLFYLQLTVIN